MESTNLPHLESTLTVYAELQTFAKEYAIFLQEKGLLERISAVYSVDGFSQAFLYGTVRSVCAPRFSHSEIRRRISELYKDNPEYDMYVLTVLYVILSENQENILQEIKEEFDRAAEQSIPGNIFTRAWFKYKWNKRNRG